MTFQCCENDAECGKPCPSHRSRVPEVADMFPSIVRRSDPKWQPWVTDLDSAYDAYWTAHNRREDQAAYHEILLFGGRDGWAGDSKWRAALARWARRFACWVEQR